MKLNDIISLGALGFAWSSNNQAASLKQQLEQQKKDQAAAEYLLNQKIDQLEDDVKGNPNTDIQVTFIMRLCGLADKLWTMSYYAILKNASKDITYDIKQITAKFTVAGCTCARFFPTASGEWKLAPGKSVEIRLSGVAHKLLYKNKSDREAIRDAIKQAAGGKKRLTNCKLTNISATSDMRISVYTPGVAAETTLNLFNLAGTCRYVDEVTVYKDGDSGEGF